VSRAVGRRPGASVTREAILIAAREAFARGGYGATSVRAVARAADVDPALVLHYFGSKDKLFEASLELPVDLNAVVEQMLRDGVDGIGERVVRTFLGVWDNTPGQGPMLAMLRGAVSHPDSADRLRAMLTQQVMRPIAAAAGADEVELRAALLASQMVGLAMARYVLRFEPLASAAADVLAPAIGATLQRYLTDPVT
jgi:AcrR family transcriptional regulator